MQNEKEKFKGTIVFLSQVFKGSNDGVFRLETHTRGDVEVLTVFHQNEESDLESERRESVRQQIKPLEL